MLEALNVSLLSSLEPEAVWNIFLCVVKFKTTCQVPNLHLWGKEETSMRTN